MDVTTEAGSSKVYQDGQGTAAKFEHPKTITINSGACRADGGTFVVQGGHSIRTVLGGGAASTFAGSGVAGFQGTVAQFNAPLQVVRDPEGNLYVADAGGKTRIRKITPGGLNISTFAGTGTRGGKDGACSEATFHSPKLRELQ